MNFCEPIGENLAVGRSPANPVLFEHERLDVYQLLLRFIAWVTPVVEEARTIAPGKSSEVCDQLDRASISALLKTAAANGERRRLATAKLFDDARKAATECAGCLDALMAKGVFGADRMYAGKALLLRIVSMLCGLVNGFDDPCSQAEDPMPRRSGSETVFASRKRTKKATRKFTEV